MPTPKNKFHEPDGLEGILAIIAHLRFRIRSIAEDPDIRFIAEQAVPFLTSYFLQDAKVD